MKADSGTNQNAAAADTAEVQNPDRLAALERTGLLDSSPEEAFDRLTRLASKLLKVPVALVSLVDQDRQYFKSQTGLPEPWASLRQTPLTHSFCQHVVQRKAPLIVHDASAVPLVSENLAVKELGVAAYAGIPLTTSDGYTLGAFCAIDSNRREWSEEELNILRELTASAITEIELRAALRNARLQADFAEQERDEKLRILDALGQPVYRLDQQGRCTFINRAVVSVLGYAPEQVIGQVMHEMIHSRHSDGSIYPQADCPVLRTLETGKPLIINDDLYWHRDGSPIPVECTASPILDAQGVSGVVVSFSDITARKLMLQRLSAQHAVSLILAQATSFETAAGHLLKAVGEALDWQFAALWLPNEDPAEGGGNNTLRCANIWCSPGLVCPDFLAATSSLELRIGEGLAGEVWKSGEPFWCNQSDWQRFLIRAPSAAREHLQMALAFPLQGMNFVGVMELFTVHMRPPDKQLIATVSTLGRQIGQFVERRNAEAALRQSEARKTGAFEASLDCIISIDGSSRIIEWNKAAERVFGYARERAMGSSMPDLIVPLPFREKHREGMRHLAATGEGPLLERRTETTAVRADGTEFPVELTISPISLDSGTIFTAFVRDITERKLADEAIRRSTCLANYTAEVGFALTAETDLCQILQTCAELAVQHLEGVVLACIWTIDGNAPVPELQACAGAAQGSGAAECLPAGGTAINVIAFQKQPHLTEVASDNTLLCSGQWALREGVRSFAGYPLIVEDRVLGVLGLYSRSPQRQEALRALESVAHGIALVIQRKRVEDALNKAMDAAEVANRAKSLFLANMSHELRTPLNAVILYSELLQEEAKERELQEFLPDLEKIRAAGRHLLSLINNILDLSRIEAGKMELYFEAFEVLPVVNDVVAIMRPLVEKHANTILVHVDGDPGVIKADLTKVRQVLLNLVSNAAKFTSRGEIRIGVKRRLTDGVDSIWFEVADTGIGMSPEQLSGLFQAFTQVDASTTRRYGGTGLGLAICRHLVSMMGGSIDLTSEPGKGTTFTVRLPAGLDTGSMQEPQETAREEVECASNTKCLILVIDDDAGVRETMSRILKKESYRVLTANSGSEGLRIARESAPDVITLDAIMPNVDGWAVLQALKVDPILALIPVIMLTVTDDRKLGYQLGAAEYLNKPIDRNRLIGVLESLCRERKADNMTVKDK